MYDWLIIFFFSKFKDFIFHTKISTEHRILITGELFKLKLSPCLYYLVQIYPGAVELMQVIEDFIHIVGLGMKDFHNAYLMTGNLGKNRPTLPSGPQPLRSFYHLFWLDMDT